MIHHHHHLYHHKPVFPDVFGLGVMADASAANCPALLRGSAESKPEASLSSPPTSPSSSSSSSSASSSSSTSSLPSSAPPA
eukprot:12426164-Karenia_brevis.AAC.1